MEETVCKCIFLTSLRDLQVSFKGGNGQKRDFTEYNDRYLLYPFNISLCSF